MADDIDAANDHALMMIDIAIKTRKPEPRIITIGYCMNCKNSVKGTLRWCDRICRDEWESNK